VDLQLAAVGLGQELWLLLLEIEVVGNANGLKSQSVICLDDVVEV